MPKRSLQSASRSLWSLTCTLSYDELPNRTGRRCRFNTLFATRCNDFLTKTREDKSVSI